MPTSFGPTSFHPLPSFQRNPVLSTNHNIIYILFFFCCDVNHNAAAKPEYSSEYKTGRGCSCSASTKRKCRDASGWVASSNHCAHRPMTLAFRVPIMERHLQPVLPSPQTLSRAQVLGNQPYPIHEKLPFWKRPQEVPQASPEIRPCCPRSPRRVVLHLGRSMERNHGPPQGLQ